MLGAPIQDPRICFLSKEFAARRSNHQALDGFDEGSLFAIAGLVPLLAHTTEGQVPRALMVVLLSFPPEMVSNIIFLKSATSSAYDIVRFAIGVLAYMSWRGSGARDASRTSCDRTWPNKLAIVASLKMKSDVRIFQVFISTTKKICEYQMTDKCLSRFPRVQKRQRLHSKNEGFSGQYIESYVR